MRKLFYKGKEISSEDAHKLDAKDKAFLTGRKPSLEKSKKEEKKNERPNTNKRN